MDDGGFSKKPKTTCPLLNKQTPHHPIRQCRHQLWDACSGAAGGEDGSARLLPAVLVGTLQEQMSPLCSSTGLRVVFAMV